MTGITTGAYTRTHRALTLAGREFGVEPMVARVALALWERGGCASSAELYVDVTGAEASSLVRRALLTMYARDLATGTGLDGGPRKRGTHVRVELANRGRALATRVIELSANGGPPRG